MEEEWSTLTNVFDEVEADIICGLLESENIKSKKEYTGPFPGMKVIFGQENGFSILVPSDRLVEAEKLLTSFED